MSEEQTVELTQREKNLRVVLLNTLMGAIKAEVDTVRAATLKELLQRFDEEGTTKFNVTLPGSTKPLASITLPLPAATQNVDEVKFLAWAKESAPELVTEVVVPAQEETRYVDFDKKARTAFINSLILDEETGVYCTEDGVVPDGITYRAGGRPDRLTVTASAANKARLLEAYNRGELRFLESSVPIRPAAIEQGDLPPWERGE